VHGEKDNVVFNMASQFDLLMESLISYDIEKQLFIDSSGNIVNKEISEELFGILDGISNSSKADLVNYTGSLGDYYSYEYVRVFAYLHLDSSWLFSYLFHDIQICCFQNARRIRRCIKNYHIHRQDINIRMN
jgi:hypothetical protein